MAKNSPNSETAAANIQRTPASKEDVDLHARANAKAYKKVLRTAQEKLQGLDENGQPRADQRALAAHLKCAQSSLQGYLAGKPPKAANIGLVTLAGEVCGFDAMGLFCETHAKVLGMLRTLDPEVLALLG